MSIHPGDKEIGHDVVFSEDPHHSSRLSIIKFKYSGGKFSVSPISGIVKVWRKLFGKEKKHGTT